MGGVWNPSAKQDLNPPLGCMTPEILVIINWRQEHTSQTPRNNMPKANSNSSGAKIPAMTPIHLKTFAELLHHPTDLNITLFLNRDSNSPVLLLKFPQFSVHVKGSSEVGLPLLVSILRQIPATKQRKHLFNANENRFCPVQVAFGEQF